MGRTELVSGSEIGDILEGSLAGRRPGEDECRRLLESDDVHLMGMVAGELARREFGGRATYVNNIILNYTNVCITDCKFCAFYRPPGAEDSYVLDLQQIESRVSAAVSSFGIRQVLIQGGHNPDLGISYYEEAFSMIRSKFPAVGVHGLSASEVDMIARVEKSSTREVLSRLREAGLQSVPGAGAEIFSGRVKEIISPKKISGDEWLRIMREAHEEGLPASATMMYGHVERAGEVASHLAEIASLQEETRGFMAFIPWNYEPNNTQLKEEGVGRRAGGVDLLKMVAISRMMFDGLIPHVQSSWLTNGVGMAQMALMYGADDFGGTLVGEEVVSCTGARSTELSGAVITGAVRQIGYEPVERDNFYNAV
ncbi:Cyclic dehypoxanthine futalosine synthase [Nitrosopumilaceae archaeon]|nr:dehypoxanthine futalosine cyclase [Nitrosopumilus sp.]CAI9832710.1 Cyclic dehypoxanthine futalosine synthase [Nitrosopumilaceae archaeon]MDA7940696.1 dehypoxanthine futalosine cyclase [Nitrosopumilus sp.]MDA7942904.1 dehypoxanthine futalosine cyclase [Nitrosopumilus sp.]MDA7944685.1 dehypoxanthine futalosine cyclase [Nitrosopumilus sp.]